MAYNEHTKKATLKYKKEKQHPVSLSYKKDEWEMEIEPVIKSSGMAVATYFKLAVEEKMRRDQEKRDRQKQERQAEDQPAEPVAESPKWKNDNCDILPNCSDKGS